MMAEPSSVARLRASDVANAFPQGNRNGFPSTAADAIAIPIRLDEMKAGSSRGKLFEGRPADQSAALRYPP